MNLVFKIVLIGLVLVSTAATVCWVAGANERIAAYFMLCGWFLTAFIATLGIMTNGFQRDEGSVPE